MIKYFKNHNSVVKVDTETKILIFCIMENTFNIIRQDSSPSAYKFVTITKYQEGKYVDATEEESLVFKDLCLNKFN
jgi:hypothetical protein